LAGADREARTRGGDTPLILAAAAGKDAVVRQLARAGADLEAPNRLGRSALLAAAAARQGASARALVELVASRRVRDAETHTAEELARDAGDTGLAALLAAR